MQIETLLDASVAKVKEICGDVVNAQGRLTLSLGKLKNLGGKVVRKLDEQSISRSFIYNGLDVIELESGTILIKKNKHYQEPVRPTLQSIASELGVSILNSNGNPFNTRQLGTHILNELLSK